MLVTSSIAKYPDREALLLSILHGPWNIINSPNTIWILLSITLPAAALFGLTFIWLPFLYDFYRSRYPWISMKTAQPAHLSITLDYSNGWFAIFKAARNRHWVIVLLFWGSLMQVLIPLALNLHFSPGLVTTPTETLKAVQSYTWREEISGPVAATQTSFNHALGRLFSNMNSGYHLARWSSQHGALPFVNTNAALPTSESTHGTLRTSFLSAELECDKAIVNLTLSPHFLAEGVFFSVDHLSLSSESAADPVEGELSDPCVSSHPYSALDGKYLEKASDSRQSLCSRWWLQNSTSILTYPQPIWLLATIQGNASKSIQTGRMLFNEQPRVIGLSCKPVVKTVSGTVTLSVDHDSDNDRVTGTHPVRFEPSVEEPRLLPKITSTISFGLNASISSLNQTDGGVFADRNLISSNAFIGDVLSYVVYRFGYADRLLALNEANLKEAVSLVFSSYVSSLASWTNLLKDERFSEEVEVTYFGVKSRIAIDWTWFSFIICFVMFCSGVVKYLGVYPPRKYRLPFAPEPLVEGLRLLCHSEIVSTMEREIPNPETLSLRQFHEKVESWGWKYKLGLAPVDGFEHVVIEVLGNTSDEDYRDEA